jgi:hypothetical protein
MSEEKRPAWVELLSRPGALAAAEVGWRREGVAYLVALVGGAALYGAAGGFFDGGWQVWVGAAKVPLVLAGALLLCLPSFVVVHLLAGVELPVGRLVLVLAGLGGLVGLLAGALVPIGWLFSVSSRSASFVVFVHAVVWSVVVLLGLRFLRATLAAQAGGGASYLWVLLLWLVALQLASLVGPVVHRAPGEAAWKVERGFFVARWIDAATREEGVECGGCEGGAAAGEGGVGGGGTVP